MIAKMKKWIIQADLLTLLDRFPMNDTNYSIEFPFSNLDVFPGKSWLLVLRQALNMEKSSWIYAEMGFDLYHLSVFI